MSSQSSSTKDSSAGRRITRSKVKSGCRTCKARKLKCDEGRPACNKCISSGRTCGGYGIWGGGSSSLASSEPSAASSRSARGGTANSSIHHHQYPQQTSSGRDRITGPVIRQNPFPLLGGQHPTDAEYCYFEWFRSRTIKKLQGSSHESFWDALLMRAVFDEPAVLHAALALGSAHKRESLHGESCLPPLPPLTEDGGQGCFSQDQIEQLDDEERFALSQYTKSIRQLQPHFSNTKSRASVRVALIACMVFICLEFLRGRYRTGAEHLRSGMRLLAHLSGGGAADTATVTESQRDPADDWLVEAFGMLNLQANLLGQGTLGSQCTCIQRFESEPFPVMFRSMTQARKRLDWLIDELIHLQAETPSPQTHDRKRRILANLESWSRVYKVSRVSLVAQMGPAGQCSYTILSLYGTMAFIMASTCFHPDGERAFDAYTEDFASIVNRSLEIKAMMAPEDQWVDPQTLSSYGNYPFIVDRGWIPPLFFTAIKCRDRRIRSQAIDLLRSSGCKEGIWDSSIAAVVAEEVARLEERGITEHDHDGEHPTAQRIRDTRVTLPDHALEAIVIVCRLEPDSSGGALELTRIYDPASKTWAAGDESGQQILRGL